jgi:hypothetical protein
MRGTRVAEIADKELQEEKQPDPVQLGAGASRGVTVTVACLTALLIVGAAAATLLPSLDGFSLPGFDRLTLPKFDHFAFPGFNRTPAPKSTRVAATPLQEPAKPPRETMTVPIPDPAVTAALKDIRSSQEQSTIVLASLTRSSAGQQDDLKRISRQLSALSVQVEALAPPLTTSSIPRQSAASSIPRPHARARLIRTPRRPEPKTEGPLPPPVGPVSVGGAPLSPAPAPVSVSSAR